MGKQRIPDPAPIARAHNDDLKPGNLRKPVRNPLRRRNRRNKQ